MKTLLTVQGIVPLSNGNVVLTGLVDGPFIQDGQYGVAIVSSTQIKVEVVGSGGLERDLIKPNMQGVMVKILEGDGEMLKGATLSFENSLDTPATA